MTSARSFVLIIANMTTVRKFKIMSDVCSIMRITWSVLAVNLHRNGRAVLKLLTLLTCSPSVCAEPVRWVDVITSSQHFLSSGFLRSCTELGIILK
jgi:hypothetical protein